MQASPAALDLIKQFEGFRAKPYQDSGGIWTIGYGHISNITADTPPITRDEANRLLSYDLHSIEGWIDRYITAPLNQNQFDALCSLCFNEGSAPLRRTLGSRINARDYLDAAGEFERWVMCNGQKLKGLVTRRAAEKALFLKPVLVSHL